MIMQRQPDGTYEQIGFIKSKNGDEIDTIVDASGDIYFTQGFTREISGALPLILDSIGKNALDYKIYGNSVQDGTPTPENPIEIQSVGDKTANLFDEDYPTPALGSSIKYIPIYVGNGVFTVSSDIPLDQNSIGSLFLLSGNVTDGVSSATNMVYHGHPHSVESSGGYVTIGYRQSSDDYPNPMAYDVMLNSGSEPDNYEPYGYRIKVMSSNENLWDTELTDGYGLGSDGLPVAISNRCATLTPMTYDHIDNFRISYKSADADTHCMYSVFNGDTFVRRLSCMSGETINVSGGNKVYFSFYWLGITVSANDISEVRIELEEPIITNIYLDEPLRKIGGYIDILNYNQGTVGRNLSEFCSTDISTWVLSNSNRTTWKRYPIGCVISDLNSNSGETEIRNSRIPVDSSSFNSNNSTDMTCRMGTSKHFWVFVPFDILGNIPVENTDEILAAWSSWVSENPFTVEYIAELTTEPISLPSIPTFDGTTVISTDTEIQPSNMEIKYKARK